MLDRRIFLQAAAAALAVAPRAAGASEAPPEMVVAAPEDRLPPGLKIAPQFYPVEVAVRNDLAPGSIIVISSKHFLYFITGKGRAIRYGVAVGKAELVFRGQAVVGEMKEWPSWRPTPEMIARNPGAYAKYAEGMPGGPRNPLGARAIYLHQNGRDTAIRIHGTIEPNSIGHSVSNGCIRMVNEHVMDLYARVSLGTPVTVF